MSGDTSFWIAVGAVGLGSTAVAAAAGLTDPLRRARRAHRGRLPGPPAAAAQLTGVQNPGDWDIGDPKLAAQVFTALCQLRHQLTTVGAPLPELTAVLVGYDRVVLRLARPTPVPGITPWRQPAGDHTGECWLADTAEIQEWAPGPVPYPALTVVGGCGGWTVLLDLARSPGPVGIAGEDAPARQVREALTRAVAASPWSRGVELVTPEPGVPAGLPAPPHRLVVALGRPPGESWTLALRPDGWLELEPLGLAVVPPGAATAGAAPSGRAAPTSPPPASPPPAPPVSAATAGSPAGPVTDPAAVRARAAALTAPVFTEEERDRWWPAPVEVGVLGPLRVRAPGSVDQARYPVLGSLAAVAALQRDGAPATLRQELLPSPAQVADAARHLHDWLGGDRTGLPRLREHGDNWRLADDVRTDWMLFQELASTEGPDNELARLLTALGLIRGELLGGTPLVPAAQRLVDRDTRVRPLVIQTVRRAAALAAGRGEPATVGWVLRQGVALLPRVEGLWRTLLLFQAEQDPARLPGTADEMLTALAAGRQRVKLERATRQVLAKHGLADRRPARTGDGQFAGQH